jgi:competence protein ComEC
LPFSVDQVVLVGESRCAEPGATCERMFYGAHSRSDPGRIMIGAVTTGLTLRRRLGRYRNVALLLAAVTVMVGGSPSDAGVTAAAPSKVIFVNVGQGDAVVMRIGGEVIVSDTGEHRYEVLDEALREGVKAKRVDVLILGHPHDDHSRNAARLLREWQVGRVVMNRSLWWDGTKSNRAVLAAVRDEPGLEREFPRAGNRFGWGGAEWIFLNPPAEEFLSASSRIAGNSSLAYLLRVNGVTALFTGDVERNVAKRVARILDPALDEPVDIFLATHHGSKEGSVNELLDVIRPRWAVLSTGENDFEHPSLEAISRLKGAGASIWCTDTNGSVTARISARGTLTWKASVQVAPWWSAKARRQTGLCVKR